MVDAEVLYGVAYYPEHWPRKRWDYDARILAECGFNTVRVGEFAWSRFEPRPGEYDFGWMDAALDVFAHRGIRTVMGTPTSNAPSWFSRAHPDSLTVDRRGRRAAPVHRYYTCIQHPAFIRASRELVKATVARFGSDSRIIGWHIANELSGTRCFCALCRTAFHDWLRERYGSLKELNRRWGTAFWSQIYNQWDEIPAPVETHGQASPALALDWERFSMAGLRRYARMQSDIIRSRSTGRWISTNLRSRGHESWLSTVVDSHDPGLFDDLDRVGYNNYPRTWDRDDALNSMRLDAIRHPRSRMNPVSFEQRGGQPGVELVSRLISPEALRLLAWQAFAHGAGGLMFFRERIATYGHENLWGGIMRHDGSLHPLASAAAKRIGGDLGKTSAVVARGVIDSPIAFLRSQDSVWALARQPQQERFSYDRHMLDYYQAGVRFGANLDVIGPDDDLDRYRVLMMPAHYVMTPVLADRLRRFAVNGGVLLATFRSAVVDENAQVPGMEPPAWLHDVFGLRVEGWDVQETDRYGTRPGDPPGRIRFSGGALGTGTAEARLWYDIITPVGAEIAAVYDSGWYRGKPAIAVNRVGKGRAVYVGTCTEPRGYDAIFRRTCALAGVKPLARLPGGVEVRERACDGKRSRFFLNYADTPKRIRVGPGWTDALTGKAVPAVLRIPALGVAILQETR
jgi:beta-galactosidase